MDDMYRSLDGGTLLLFRIWIPPPVDCQVTIMDFSFGRWNFATTYLANPPLTDFFSPVCSAFLGSAFTWIFIIQYSNKAINTRTLTDKATRLNGPNGASIGFFHSQPHQDQPSTNSTIGMGCVPPPRLFYRDHCLRQMHSYGNPFPLSMCINDLFPAPNTSTQHPPLYSHQHHSITAQFLFFSDQTRLSIHQHSRSRFSRTAKGELRRSKCEIVSDTFSPTPKPRSDTETTVNTATQQAGAIPPGPMDALI